MVIKKIFEKVFDKEVHSDFLKFGRGEFRNRYLLEGKKQKDKWSIKTSSEFVNFLVRKCLNKIQGRILISGIIISTIDLTGEINFQIKKKSNFRGVRKFAIETEVSAEEIIRLMEKYPRIFFALSFKGDDFELKVKPKAPKNKKSGKESDDKPRADFCSVKTNNQEIINELFFEHPDFKEIKINHTIKIEDIVYPQNMESLKPEEVREQSKRKVKLIREIIVDGKEEKKETEFIA